MDLCTYNEKCLAEAGVRFPGLRICDKHAMAVHELVEMKLAIEMIRNQNRDGATIPPAPEGKVSPMRKRVAEALDGFRQAKDPGHPGFVYFVRFDSMVKIGYSRHPRQRLQNVPHEEVLRIVEGSMADEKRAHLICAKWRVVGEWFRDCPEFRAAIGLDTPAKNARNA